MYYDNMSPMEALSQAVLSAILGTMVSLCRHTKRKAGQFPVTFSRLPDTMMAIHYRYTLWKLYQHSRHGVDWETGSCWLTTLRTRLLCYVCLDGSVFFLFCLDIVLSETVIAAVSF
jgi:hypothetical protein